MLDIGIAFEDEVEDAGRLPGYVRYWRLHASSTANPAVMDISAEEILIPDPETLI